MTKFTFSRFVIFFLVFYIYIRIYILEYKFQIHRVQMGNFFLCCTFLHIYTYEFYVFLFFVLRLFWHFFSRM